jgi:putative oxidoreductase
MTTNIDVLPPPTARMDIAPTRLRQLRVCVPVGRVLFAAIFILASGGQFSAGAIHYAAAQGVPWASLLVPLSGVLALAGGLSVLFGYKTRLGAALLVLFLVPVTLAMHRFWAIPDPQLAMLQRVMFLKNLSMLGGALLFVYYGGGPMSVDTRPVRRT